MSGTTTNSAISLDDDAPAIVQDIPVQSPSINTNAPSPSQRSMLTKVLSHMEMDPCYQEAWLASALEENSRDKDSTLLEIFTRKQKDQVGGFIDNSIGVNTYNTVVAPPQAGKTQGIMLTAVEAAYDSNILTVMSVMNSLLETPRFRDTSKKLNGIVVTVASALGISPQATPELKIFDERSSITYKKALEKWRMGSNVIPVFVVMMNNTKFNRFQRDHLFDITKAVERDATGHIKAMLVTDEADLQYKTVDSTSALERSIFSRKVTIGQQQFGGLQEVFTTITNVTATPQAIASGQVDFGGRVPVIFEPPPSKSNFQYHTKSNWSNKLITRVPSENVEEMYADMMTGPENRYALVYVSKNNVKSGRTASALATSDKFVGKPGVVTFAWSSSKIEVFTSDAEWIRVLRGAANGVFSEKIEGKGIVRFTGTKSVNSYPAVLSFMSNNSGDSPKCKFILFSKELCDRAVPVKGLGHEWPLTDMWMDSPNMHQEGRIQVAGRLCGIDPIGAVKKLWCSEEEHTVHQKAIDTCQYVVDMLLKKGIGALDAIAKTRKTLVDLTDDTPVVSKIVVDEDGAIANLGGTKISRPSAGKRVRESAVDTKRMATSKKMKLQAEEYKSGVEHSDVPVDQTTRMDDDSEEYVPVGQSVGDGSSTDPGTLQQMRESISGESGDGVAKAILEVIRENGGSIGFNRVPMDMASRSSYPDGTSFSPSAFLKFIVRDKMDVLSRNGIQFTGGNFSEIEVL